MSSPIQADPLVVLCPIQPVADWVRQVGGDRVEVWCLVPPGQSPHTFAPSLKETSRFSRTQVTFEIGRGLDEWIYTKVLKTLATAPRRVILSEGLLALNLYGETVDATAVVPLAEEGHHDPDSEEAHNHDHGHSHGGGEGHFHDPQGADPHVWLSPDLAIRMVERIAQALAEMDPEGAAKYRQNAGDYVSKIQAIDDRALRELGPLAGRPFISVHSAFVYFAHRYGLRQAALLEWVPGVPPSLREVQAIGRIYEQNPSLEIWIEPQLSDREARLLAQELGGLPVRKVDPLGLQGESYLDLMERNLETLLAPTEVPAILRPQAGSTGLGGSLFLRALFAALLLGGICSLLSVIVVLRKMAFVGQGLSHAALGGVGLALLLFPAASSGDWKITLGTAIAVLATAAAVAVASRQRQISEDTAIGVFFVGVMALGIVALRLSAGRPGGPVDPFSYLFGSAALIARSDLYFIGAIATVGVAFLGLRYHELHFMLYDERMARLSGVPTEKLHYLLIGLLALTIVCALNLIGIVLMSAYLVIPGAIGRLMTQRFCGLFLIAFVVGVITSVGGLLLSYWVELPSGATLPAGATVVLLQFVLFLIVMGASRLRRV